MGEERYAKWDSQNFGVPGPVFWVVFQGIILVLSQSGVNVLFGFQIGGKCSLYTAQLSGGWKLISIYFLKSSSVLMICYTGVLFIQQSDVTNSEDKLRQFSNSLTFYFRIFECKYDVTVWCKLWSIPGAVEQTVGLITP